MTASLADIPWPVRTDRLVLRPATADDVDATFAIRRRPEVSAWLTAHPTDRDEFAVHFTEPDRLGATVAIELADTATGEMIAGETVVADSVVGVRVVGELMVKIEDAWAQLEARDLAVGRQAELGWVLAPEHGGRGYATEAVSEAIRWCFERLDVHRVVAHCFAENTASWRLMERVGMRREAHAVRDSLHRSGRWMDGYSYAILADEWHAGR